MKYSVGVDLGSTAIKVVFVQNNTLIWHKAIPTAPGQEALANKVIEEGIRELDISKDDILGVAATGYGKNLMNIADKVIDEVSANALGLHLLSGAAAKVIINIGGQDIKIIQLDANGKLLEFKMNDKILDADVSQAAKYNEYLEVLFGPEYEVISALVLTRAEDLYTYVPVGRTTAEIAVCSGDMLFNVFNEYLGFFQ